MKTIKCEEWKSEELYSEGGKVEIMWTSRMIREDEQEVAGWIYGGRSVADETWLGWVGIRHRTAIERRIMSCTNAAVLEDLRISWLELRQQQRRTEVRVQTSSKTHCDGG